MITSKSNEQVKYIIQLQKKARARRKEDCFVAEGLRMVSETPKEFLQSVYLSESFIANHGTEPVYEAFAKQPGEAKIALEEVSDAVMQAMSDTIHPQGILAVIRQPHWQMESLLAGTPHLLLLENVQDPGNLGTMFRTAEGACATGIIMSRDTVDIFSPKVIRSTMGAIYRVPWIIAEDWDEALSAVKAAGVKLYAAHLHATADYDACDYAKPTGFLIGNEGNGLTDATADQADAKIRIPMGGKLESLNAAMAAGILMYECLRQRRHS